MMKQVARKSTTSIPQKFSAGSNQQNGLVPLQESPAQKTPARVPSNLSLLSSKDASAQIGHCKILNTNSSDQHTGVHLTNGIHDSREQSLGNKAGCSDAMPNTHSVATAAADTVRQQTTGHSVCTVTSASNVPVSATRLNVQLPTLSQTSSNTENSKNLNDVPVKQFSTETVKPSSHAASVATSSKSTDDVIIVTVDDDSKPTVDAVKRPVSPADDKKCEVKKARLDGAAGQSVEANVQLAHKEMDRYLLDFGNRYLKSTHNSDIFLMSKKIKEMQENQNKLQIKAQEFHRKFIELSVKQSKIAHPSATTSPQVPVQLKSLSNSPLKPHSALPANTATLSMSPRMTQTLLAPCRLPAASVNLAAMPRLVTINQLQAHAVPVNAAAGSAVSTGTVADSSKSFIDLTADEDTHAPAAKPLTQTPQLFLIAPQQTASIPALTLASSTAVVRSMRPAPPPPLHVAPSLQARLQSSMVFRHPAPLPAVPLMSAVPLTAKLVPPKPTLKLSRVANGIVLSWNMALTSKHETAAHYHLYAYQEGSEPPSTSMWKKIGTVNSLPLPMACTLTQFHQGNIYHFAVRAVDIYGRCSAFSEPGSIHLDPR